MANEKLTAKKVVTIVLLTAAACVPGIFVYLVITLLLGPLFGSFSPFVSLLVIGVPLLIATAYTLKKRRSVEEKDYKTL